MNQTSQSSKVTFNTKNRKVATNHNYYSIPRVLKVSFSKTNLDF